MKTGRLDYYLPNPRTVLHDIQNAFIQVHHKLAAKLQVGSVQSYSPNTTTKLHT